MKKFNEKLAILGTEVFSSMWTFYIFFIWGLLGVLPWLPQHFKDIVLLVSSAWIQLWALPLISVGASVIARRTERRSQKDHEMIRSELERLKKIESMLEDVLNKNK